MASQIPRYLAHLAALQTIAATWPGSTRGMVTDFKGDNRPHDRYVADIDPPRVLTLLINAI